MAFYLAFPHPRLTTPKSPLTGMVCSAAAMLKFEFTVRGSGLANGKDGVDSGKAVLGGGLGLTVIPVRRGARRCHPVEHLRE